MTIKNEKQVPIFTGWYLTIGEWNGARVWGLSTGNHPEFMWDITLYPPIQDPMEGFSDEQIDALADDSQEWLAWNQFVRCVEYVEEKLVMPPELGYSMTIGALSAGYDFNVHGSRLANWLVNRVAKLLATL